MNGVETKYFNDDVERDEELGEIKIGSKNNKIKIIKPVKIIAKKKVIKEKENDSFEAKEAI